MNNPTLADIVSRIAGQGNNPDVSFLKDNPEAQTILLMALLQNSNTTTNNTTAGIDDTTIAATTDNTDKRKYDAFNYISSNNNNAAAATLPSPNSVTDSEAPKKAGRKPVTSEEEDSDDPKSKRKAQNRAAQRAFRERKESHVKILEDRVKELEELAADKNNNLIAENEELKETIARLQNENAALHGSMSSFDTSLSKVPGNFGSMSEERPQKIIRASDTSTNMVTSPNAAQFDNFSSCSYSTSSKSRSNTPEIHANNNSNNAISYQATLDDILGLDTSVLPSNTILDHSELLGLGNNGKIDYNTQLDDILNQHRLNSFVTDPSQFDFYYPLQAVNNENLVTDADTTDLVEKENKTREDEHKHKHNVAKFWDKIAEHPRFEEFDMDLLCSEMKKKAKCSELSMEKHEEVLQELVDRHYPDDQGF